MASLPSSKTSSLNQPEPSSTFSPQKQKTPKKFRGEQSAGRSVSSMNGMAPLAAGKKAAATSAPLFALHGGSAVIPVDASCTLTHEFPSIGHATDLLNAMEALPDFGTGTTPSLTSDFLSGIENSDPADPSLSEDDTGSSWGRHQFTGGNTTVKWVIRSWDSTGSAVMACKLISPVIRTCKVARHICIEKGVNATSFLVEVYPSHLIDEPWDVWAKAGPVLTGEISTTAKPMDLDYGGPPSPPPSLPNLPPTSPPASTCSMDHPSAYSAPSLGTTAVANTASSTSAGRRLCPMGGEWAGGGAGSGLSGYKGLTVGDTIGNGATGEGVVGAGEGAAGGDVISEGATSGAAANEGAMGGAAANEGTTGGRTGRGEGTMEGVTSDGGTAGEGLTGGGMASGGLVGRPSMGGGLLGAGSASGSTIRGGSTISVKPNAGLQALTEEELKVWTQNATVVATSNVKQQSKDGEWLRSDRHLANVIMAATREEQPTKDQVDAILALRKAKKAAQKAHLNKVVNA